MYAERRKGSTAIAKATRAPIRHTSRIYTANGKATIQSTTAPTVQDHIRTHMSVRTMPRADDDTDKYATTQTGQQRHKLTIFNPHVTTRGRNNGQEQTHPVPQARKTGD